jgi:UDP-N-acetylglucosamine 2-epimerase
LGTPCITLRDETEWVETVDLGWNVIAGRDPDVVMAAVARARPSGPRPEIYGDGRAAERIVRSLVAWADDGSPGPAFPATGAPLQEVSG